MHADTLKIKVRYRHTFTRAFSLIIMATDFFYVSQSNLQQLTKLNLIWILRHPY